MITQKIKSSNDMSIAVDFDPFANTEHFKIAPITELQKEIWLSSQMGHDANCSWISTVCLNLKGELDREALGNALNYLFMHHEALRSRFSENGESILIDNHAVAEIIEIDLQAQTNEEQMKALEAFIYENQQTSFDLTREFGFRFHLFVFSHESYCLVVTHHHIVCDGYSDSLFFQQLAEAYTAYEMGREPNFPPAHQASDFAAALASIETSPNFARARNYWHKIYSTMPPVYELPTDQLRPQYRSYVANAIDHIIDDNGRSNIRQAAQRNNVTPYIFMISVFYACLYRWTKERDLIVGIPCAGNLALGFDDIVTHAVNMLPLRIEIDPEQSLSSFLTSMKTIFFEAIDHQFFSYGHILKNLDIERNPAYVPLIPVVFNRNVSGKQTAFGTLSLDLQYAHRIFENGDVFFNTVENDEKIKINCTFNRNIYSVEIMQQRLHEFERALQAACDDASISIAKMPLLSTKAYKKQVLAWNDTRETIRNLPKLHEQISALTDSYGDKVALQDDANIQNLSYYTLEKLSNDFASTIHNYGITKGSVIGLCVERTPQMVAAILGIFKAGCIYLPLDPTLPKERLNFMINDAAANALITDTTCPILADFTQCILIDSTQINKDKDKQTEQEFTQNHKVRALNDINEKQKCSSELEKDDDENKEELAYILYTSGSTGKPNGVCVSHYALANLMHAMRSCPSMSESDVMLAATNISFDISLLELLLPLTVGASIILARHETIMDGYALAERLDHGDVTLFQATPSVFRFLLESGWKGHDEMTLWCGGEALDHELAIHLAEKSAALWNMYGPTETTIWSAIHKVDIQEEYVPIGGPIANTAFYILDEYGQHCPIGIAGELHIAGSGLAKGYWKRDTLTAKRFVECEIDNEAIRLYRTGDRVMWRKDGTLRFLGRLDHQIKLRGHRIELSEIESVLQAMPMIDEAVVIMREDHPNDQRLAAYIRAVKTPNTEQFNEEALRYSMRQSLPEYMIPADFIFLNSFPLTPNKKIDRKALPEPQRSRPNIFQHRSEPKTFHECAVAEIWSKLLGVEHITVDDNFFDLGGYSILSVKVIAHMEDLTAIRLTPTELIYQTLGQFAARYDEQADKETETEIDLGSQQSKIKNVSAFLSRLMG